MNLIQTTKKVLEQKPIWATNGQVVGPWLEKIKNSKNPAMLYFEAFDHLIDAHLGPDDFLEILDPSYPSNDASILLFHKECRGLLELGILMKEGFDPLSVKNEQGQNPFEYFYHQNRKKRILTPLNKMDLEGQFRTSAVVWQAFHDHLSEKIEKRVEEQVGATLKAPLPLFDFQWLRWSKREDVKKLREKLFAEYKGEFDKIRPLQKTVDLWENAGKLASKKKDEVRVTYMNLLKMTRLHPHGALSSEQLKKLVEEKIEQEKALEEEASSDLKKGITPPGLNPEHHRRLSPWAEKRFQYHMLRKYIPEAERFPQFPKTRKQAVADFLLSLQGLTKKELESGKTLTTRRIMAYQHALHPVREFRRTR